MQYPRRKIINIIKGWNKNWILVLFLSKKNAKNIKINKILFSANVGNRTLKNIKLDIKKYWSLAKE